METAKTTSASDEAKKDVSQLKGRILLVEDTEALQDLTSMHLKKMGLDVVIAENGEEAIEKALSEDFDLVYMDIQMPVMDGLTATRELREKGYQKTIVAMTANAMKEDRHRCFDAGCDDFIGKPVQRKQLYEMSSKYLTSGA